MLQGQDWSSYQSVTPPTPGLAFAFVKATEGLGYVNPKAAAQIDHGRSAGLTVGWYHYPHIANSASAEADYFLSHAAVQPGDLIALDWEWYGQTVTDDQARAYKAAWLSRVRLKLSGHRVGLYVDRSNWTTVDQDSDCGDFLWIADVTTVGQPRITHPWTFHQYSSQGGIDRDVANFPDAAALKAWAAGSTPTPTPEADVALTPADAKTVLTTDGIIPAPAPPVAAGDYATNKTWTLASTVAAANQAAREANANTKTLLAQVAALTTKVDALSTALSGLTADGLVAQVAAELGKLSISLNVKEGS